MHSGCCAPGAPDLPALATDSSASAGTFWRLLRGFVTMLIFAAAGPSQAADAATNGECKPNPFGERELFLRGGFNHWRADDEHRFDYRCDRFSLVARLRGAQQFKIADDNWSADADLGGTLSALQLRGAALEHVFDRDSRLTLTMSQPPSLRIDPCQDAPFGETTLFLRGSMNNWTALDRYAFQFHCDAYYLNIDLAGEHEFKVADAAWTVRTTLVGGNAQGDGVAMATAETGQPNIRRAFNGAHTLRLAFDKSGATLALGPRSFRDGAAEPITDPVARGVRFDSRSIAHKAPFGAVSAGSEVCYRLLAPVGVTRATLVLETRTLTGNQEVLDYTPWQRIDMAASAADGGRQRWAACARFDAPGIYGYHFVLDIGGRQYVFQNNADTVFWTREAGTMGAGEIAAMPTSARRIRRYRQTVFAADFAVPAWARDVVWYYIFPDRFRNGNRANDPRPGRDRYHDGSVEFHANWNDKPWRPGTGDGSDALHNNDFFGGDLAGITEKLDDIADLGANAIYMTPIFRAASNHKYDTADYRSIDPAFGSDAEFDRLIAEAGRRGIRVVLDASLNHVGADSMYFDRYGNFGGKGAFAGGKPNPASPYADWFRIDAAQTDPDKQYHGWGGVKDLPEIDKRSASFRDFAHRAPDSVMKRWLDRGTAGWRMDVAPWVPDDFWREWRREIKRHRPDALTVAETWFDASKYFVGDMFDSTMNYIFRNAVLEYANGGDATKLYANIELMREAYPPQAFYALMNLTSTHDQARSLHVFGADAPGGGEAALRLAKQRLRLATFFQMIFPGAPAVYYGDEVGVGGGDDPYNRGTYPWRDLGGVPDEALRADFKRMIGWRREHAILRHGSIGAPLHLDAHVIVLHRVLGGQHALVVMNNDTQPRKIDVTLPAGVAAGKFRRIDVNATAGANGGRVTLDVPSLGGALYLSE